MPGALGYAVQYLNDDGTWNIMTLSCTETKYKATGLDSGKKYTFLIQAAFRNNRYSSFTQSDYVYIETTDAKPTVKATAANDGEVLLTWDNKASAAKFAVKEYRDNN